LAWFVVIATLMFLYGSFMMVRPSARQRHIAALRQSAISRGLEVRLASRMKLPEELSRPDMACLLSHRGEGQVGSSGSSFRNPETAKIRSYGVFSSRDEQIQKIFEILPEGTEALISGESYVAVCWDEKGDDEAVDSIAKSMQSILDLTAA